MNLSEKIQRCRKRAGLSQEALAERLSVSRQAVSKWETGAAEPELSKLRALAAIFGVTADWLLSDESAEFPADTPGNGNDERGDASAFAAGETNVGQGSACASGAAFGSNGAPNEGASNFESQAASSGGSASSSGAASARTGADGEPFAFGRSDVHSECSAPNWVESVPGVLGRLLRQYGWIVGLRIAISGALMTFVGFLGRAAVKDMDQGFGMDIPELMSSQTAWYDEAGNLMTSPVSMPSQPSDPMTILCTGMVILGVILILVGACIAVSLKNSSKK